MNTLIDLTNQRFGMLVVREKCLPTSDGRTRWLCDCDCGNSCVATSYALRVKKQQSCGCGKIKKLKGQRFGQLVVLKRSEHFIVKHDGTKKYMWECRCDCGAIVYKLSEKLHSGENHSCTSCAQKAAVEAMVNKAGFYEGTQISKLKRTEPNSTNTSGVRGVFLISAPEDGELY